MSAADAGVDAWDRFCDALKAAGRTIREAAPDPASIERAEGMRFLTRMLRHSLEAQLEYADPDFPAFYCPSHETIKLNADNPDTLHFMAPLSGRHAYRLAGTRGSVHRIVFTTLARAPGRTDYTVSGALDTRELALAADGTFEIAVARKPARGNWLPMREDTVALLVRAIFLDREREAAPALRLDRIGTRAAPAVLAPAAIDARLAAVAASTAGLAQHMARLAAIYRERGWINRLEEDAALWGSGDPSARYLQGWWQLAPDEALVVESDVPECFFWNFQLNNAWMESLDYRWQRIHVNKAGAHYEADGRVRIVIAHSDPGLPNWLSTAGHGCGTMVSRWIEARAMPRMTARVLPLAALRG
ncbi:MAG: DUF1214 domain-containing protein [Gammaproteobacteria bacterium]